MLYSSVVRKHPSPPQKFFPAPRPGDILIRNNSHPLAKNPRTNHSFSIGSELFPIGPHLAENKRPTHFRKPIVFNQLRTLSHSFPVSYSFSICSQNQRGVY